MIELTEAQRQELKRLGQTSVRDPETGQTYVMVRTEVYQRLMAMLEDDVRLMQPLLAELSPEDWEDAANYEAKP